MFKIPFATQGKNFQETKWDKTFETTETETSSIGPRTVCTGGLLDTQQIM